MMSRDQFCEALQQVGRGKYHHLHLFHQPDERGELSPPAIRTWVTKRFFYQKSIPLKNAAILSNCPLREVRRIWLQRIIDHDGQRGDEGGIEAWLRLAEACGVDRDELGVDPLPGVRFAVGAYVQFCSHAPWPVAIASSLTEMFAPDLMAQRLAAFQKHYPRCRNRDSITSAGALSRRLRMHKKRWRLR